jgi:hypothetical protein
LRPINCSRAFSIEIRSFLSNDSLGESLACANSRFFRIRRFRPVKINIETNHHRFLSPTVLLQMPTALRPTPTSPTIDNTDWLKFAAIILVAIDHFGYFFVDDAQWWYVLGRLAAPVFFFLIGFAHSRTIPVSWIWLGVILTLLESWNDNWSWVTPNILLSFALIRISHHYVQELLLRYSWTTFALLVTALLAILPLAAEMVDFGAEGWLWSLFGLCQRMHVDRATNNVRQKRDQALKPAWRTMTESNLMRLMACLIAASIYLWQEQLEFGFSDIQLASCIFGISILSSILIFFRRGLSGVQPPKPIAQALRFTGRHTLEIYAIQLAGSELIVKFLPDLAA